MAACASSRVLSLHHARINQDRLVHYVFGANTDVGKTVLSTVLCRGLRRSQFLKPIQTGRILDADHVARYSGAEATTIYSYKEPESPHLAAAKAGAYVSDVEFRQALAGFLQSTETERNLTSLIIEAAGGVNSPGISGTPQSELYRSLRFPVVLCGDSRLGGIHATLSSCESLYMRGYDIPVLTLFDTRTGKSNGEALSSIFRTSHFGRPAPRVVMLPAPPKVLPDPIEDGESMAEYYNDLDTGELCEIVNENHRRRLEKRNEMRSKSLHTIWWPFTQHQTLKDVNIVDSAKDDTLTLATGLQTFDASQAWWTQTFGHGNSAFTSEISYAAGRYGHLLFPEHVHEPAYDLSTALLSNANLDWAQKVFYTDDGSTAVEVAIKMGIRLYKERKALDNWRQVGVVGINGGYHGDTIGAMDASPKSDFNKNTDWHQGRGVWLDAPQVLLKGLEYRVFYNGSEQPLCFDSWEEVLESVRSPRGFQREYQSMIEERIRMESERAAWKPGVLILEPMMMAAGGMCMVDPAFQSALIEVARKVFGMSVVFDEVFSGMHRLGPISCRSFLQKTPDIACYGKAITGGTVPLGITLATDEVFRCYLGPSKSEALLHGHSFSAYPIGCQVAKATLGMFERRIPSGTIGDVWLAHCSGDVMRLSELPHIKGVSCLGSVLAVEFDSETQGYTSAVPPDTVARLRELGIHVRPLGNVLYVMSSFMTQPATLKQLAETFLKVVADPV